MELDASIEPTIGPYEVYEDEWFNYKAAFESFIGVRDDTETEKLARFGAELQDIENNLPIDPKFRNPKLGALAPIRVINTVFSSGDGNRGVQTAAYNLPNDERVIAEKGSKRVMLKNNQEAKFRMVLQPIATVALASGAQSKVAFDAFFTHILMHELMHGLGPHNITVGGAATTVRKEFKELYSATEEAKADVSGLFALQFLVDRGKLDAALGETMYADLSRLDVPLDPLRHQRGARPRRRRADELLPGSRRRHRRRGRPLRGRYREDQAERHRSDARPDDHAGDRRLCGRQGAGREAGGHPSAGAGGARPPEGRAGGHRTALRARRSSSKPSASPDRPRSTFAASCRL